MRRTNKFFIKYNHYKEQEEVQKYAWIKEYQEVNCKITIYQEIVNNNLPQNRLRLTSIAPRTPTPPPISQSKQSLDPNLPTSPFQTPTRTRPTGSNN